VEKKRIQWIDNGRAVSIYIIFLAHIFEGFVYKSAYGLNAPFERGVTTLNFLSNFIVHLLCFINHSLAINKTLNTIL